MTRRTLYAWVVDFVLIAALAVLGFGAWWLLEAIGPRPWIKPKYGSWIE